MSLLGDLFGDKIDEMKDDLLESLSDEFDEYPKVVDYLNSKKSSKEKREKFESFPESKKASGTEKKPKKSSSSTSKKPKSGSKSEKAPEKSQNVGTTSLTCSNCGAQLELDLDNLEAVCPYCDSKLTIDVANLNSLLSEREETKRKQMEVEYDIIKVNNKEKEEKRLYKFLAFLFGGMFLSIIIMVLIASSLDSDVDQQEEQLQTVFTEIEELIEEKDYDMALLKANQLRYADEDEPEMEEKWDQIREDTIKIIEEKKSKTKK